MSIGPDIPLNIIDEYWAEMRRWLLTWSDPWLAFGLNLWMWCIACQTIRSKRDSLGQILFNRTLNKVRSKKAELIWKLNSRFVLYCSRGYKGTMTCWAKERWHAGPKCVADYWLSECDASRVRSEIRSVGFF